MNNRKLRKATSKAKQDELILQLKKQINQLNNNALQRKQKLAAIKKSKVLTKKRQKRTIQTLNEEIQVLESHLARQAEQLEVAYEQQTLTIKRFTAANELNQLLNGLNQQKNDHLAKLRDANHSLNEELHQKDEVIKKTQTTCQELQEDNKKLSDTIAHLTASLAKHTNEKEQLKKEKLHFADQYVKQLCLTHQQGNIIEQQAASIKDLQARVTATKQPNGYAPTLFGASSSTREPNMSQGLLDNKQREFIVIS